jgi:hypothetical protein
MAEQDPLTLEMKQAFEEAIHRYETWRTLGGDETLMQVGNNQQLFSSVEICSWILSFANEPMPDELIGVLLKLPNLMRPDLIQKLGVDGTYHAGAYVLSELINDHRKRLSK